MSGSMCRGDCRATRKHRYIDRIVKIYYNPNATVVAPKSPDKSFVSPSSPVETSIQGWSVALESARAGREHTGASGNVDGQEVIL